MFKNLMMRTNYILVLTFSTLCLFGCSDDGDTPECRQDSDCASRTDGKTTCDVKNEVCVAPTANTPECTTDAQCASRTDGKTTCDVENEVCVAPTANTPECTTDAQCASRTDGKTTCDVENEVCVAPTANTPECGNGVVEAGESCDKNDLNGKQCDQYPDYIGGTLACNAACEFDKSGCFECTETDTTLCASSEICSNGHCAPQGHQITCGDNMAEGSEACDGTDLKGKSCADFDGFHDGTLKCNQCKFDTSSCVECSLDAHCADRTDGKTKCSANVCTKPASNPVHKVVISQIYPGGGNSGAVYNTKYIELHNIDESEVDISGWSIQYSGSNKDVISSTCKLPSNVKLPQGGYYLIAFGDAGTNGGELPVTTDYKCTSIQPAAANGKLFLVNSDKQLNTSKPTSGYIDAVGYGSANWAEGTPMAALSAKKAGLRKDGGCVDTNDNSNDFEADTPSPRNSKSAVNKCDGTSAEAFCGNNSAEAGEDCDGSDLRGKSCTDFAGFSGGTLKCTSCTFDKSACKKPAECGNGILEDGEDCDGEGELDDGTFDEAYFRDDKWHCSEWDKKYNTGFLDCNINCTINFTDCSYEDPDACSHNGNVECDEKTFSLKTCVDGKWQSEKCPDDKPYCKTGNEACTKVNENDLCDPNKFAPFIGGDNYLYFCASEYIFFSHQNIKWKVRKLSCGTDNFVCKKAKTGAGFSYHGGSASSHKSEPCLEKGAVSFWVDEVGGLTEKEYVSCQQCKLNEDGELYNMIIPATYTLKSSDYNRPASCTPWPED